MIKIFIEDQSKYIEAHPEESVLEAVLKEKINISHSCGGNGTCGTCRIEVTHGADFLLPRNEIELELAMDRGYKDSERLACQTLPVESLIIKIP